METFVNNRISHYHKSSPLKLLRQHNNKHKTQLKKRIKRIRHKKFLKQQIDHNSNIFYTQKHKSYIHSKMTAQNLIWEKNYTLKLWINTLRQQNNSLKARLWNISKQNRKMNKQIDNWNLNNVMMVKNQVLLENGNISVVKKPYIDMATVQKVFTDQQYSIVSAKIQITELDKLLNKKQAVLEYFIDRSQNSTKYFKHYERQLVQKNVEFLKLIGIKPEEKRSTNKILQNREANYQGDSFIITQQTYNIREYLSDKILGNTQSLQIFHKNIDILKKLKINYEQQLTTTAKEYQASKYITQQSINLLNQQIYEMKISEDQEVNIQKQNLRIVKQQRQKYECFIQEQVGQFIKKKIIFEQKVQEMMIKLQTRKSTTKLSVSMSLKEVNKIQLNKCYCQQNINNVNLPKQQDLNKCAEQNNKNKQQAIKQSNNRKKQEDQNIKESHSINYQNIDKQQKNQYKVVVNFTEEIGKSEQGHLSSLYQYQSDKNLKQSDQNENKSEQQNQQNYSDQFDQQNLDKQKNKQFLIQQNVDKITYDAA